MWYPVPRDEPAEGGINLLLCLVFSATPLCGCESSGVTFPPAIVIA